MRFTGARIFTPNGYMEGSFETENGVFGAVYPGRAEGAVDLGGRKVLPGLVDIHTHGNSGADFSDADPGGLERMARYLARNGVTSFAPTSMTLPFERLGAAFETALSLSRNRPKDCARVMGIHMEGPFFSEKRKGAQNGAYLRNPDFESFRALYRACSGLIRIVDVAPELPGAAQFAARARELAAVSVAHTDATYEQALQVFRAGATHLTHLFNAMPPIHHRRPGVIGAASETESVTAELICDGYHIHPSAVRMAFRLFPGRICLISDSIRCCGMPDGEYELGGLPVKLEAGAARLNDGTLAGSAANLFSCLRNAVRFGISEADALRAATLLPAREIGAADRIGSIEPGKLADFVVCGEDLTVQQVFVGGVRLEGR